MNLLEFRNKIISSENNKIENDSFFSEEITIFNILNGIFKNDDILSINIDSAKKFISVEVSSEEMVNHIETRLNNQIVPGAYHPLYRVHIKCDGTKFNIYLTDDI